METPFVSVWLRHHLRSWFKNEAADAQSRRETGAEEYTDINGDIPVAVSDLFEDTSKASKGLTRTACRVCDNNNKQEPGKAMPERQFFIHEESLELYGPPTLPEFIAI